MLLQAAAELVPERGWTGVSTRTVAERAGVAPGLVHYHFASVQALLTEAALGVLREAVGGIEALLARIETPDELVEALLDHVGGYTGRDPASLLATEAYLAATRDPDLRRELAALLDGFRHTVAAWLADRDVPDPQAAAAVLAAAVDGVLLHRTLGPGPSATATAAVLRRVVASGEGR